MSFWQAREQDPQQANPIARLDPSERTTSIMTTPTHQQPPSRIARHPEFSLERVSRLVFELEQELAKAPPEIPNVQDLRQEIEALKHALASSEETDERIAQRLHTVRNALENVTARVEGEVLKDSPYIAEIGRILGLV